MRSLRAAAALVLLATGLAACSSGKNDDTPSPFADCSGLPVGAATQLPPVKVPCFTGGAQVDLSTVRGPAMINLWASWCGPCRTELPMIQRLADQNTGKIAVLTVDTGDRREAGASFATAVGVKVPTMFDSNQDLYKRLGATALPFSVFIDATGKQTVYRYSLADPGTLATQVSKGTGVKVTVTK